MKVGSLFTGYGGLDMAVEAHYGARTVWTSDVDPGACKIIAHRMPGIPNLGDITKIDWARVEPVDVLTGGFPCQDLSHAGKRAGLRPGTRSGLWSHMAYAISQLRPRYVVAENVRGLLSASADSDLESCPWCLGGPGDGEPVLRALGVILGDLAELGYDTRVHGLRAADVGAPHGRFRVFVVAADTRRPDWWREGPARGAASRIDMAARGRHEGAGSPVGGRGDDSAADAESGSGPHLAVSPHDSPLVGPLADSSTRDSKGSPTARVSELGRDTGMVWGDYEPAIRRWERVLGRPAPAPTETGPKGGQRLSPRFVEWLMGLPAGRVTEVPGLTRNAQLKALGNGVVPQQALAALRVLDGLRAAA